MKKKLADDIFDGKTFEERYKDSMARVAAYMAESKVASRDKFAIQIMTGICAGDWKFDLSNGKTWDEMAAKRAYEIADAMLAEREITTI